MSSTVKVTHLPSQHPSPHPQDGTPAHWVGDPPTAFHNPWPSFTAGNQGHGLLAALQTRFGPDRNFVPIPSNTDELVKVRVPDWGRKTAGWETKLKATWLGHAGFVVEMPCSSVGSVDMDKKQEQRGVRILFDAVFAERMSPVSFAGPKRFTATPCKLEELPDVDIVCLSHNHYDHMDIETLKHVYTSRQGKVHFFAPLGNKAWFLSAVGVQDHEVTESDWWDGLDVSVEGLGALRLTCCPAQHFSGRSLTDHGKTLWCSWAVEELPATAAPGKRLYFAGDTAYRAVQSSTPCPVFAQIGERLGPFDLSMLPIGCYSPREFMAKLHASPEDSLEIHKAVRSRKSIGMHYGVIRGGISAHYEPVTDPPQRWRACCEKEGRWESGECGLSDVGETVMV